MSMTAAGVTEVKMNWLRMIVLFLLILNNTAILSNCQPLNSTFVAVNSTYDYVVVGCGVSGLVVAARLSEDPNISVLCLEAGQFDQNEDYINYPVYIGEQPSCFYDWCLTTVNQTQLDGNTRRVPMGRGVGGGSLINGMLWNRGSASDFDAWASFGNPGWSWNEILAYFNKTETYTPACYTTQPNVSSYMNFNAADHGFWGPVNVSYPSYSWPQSNNFFEALSELGVPLVSDPNNGHAAGGLYISSSLDPINQTRSTARKAYYDPYYTRNNLQVQDNSQVTRIIFGDGTGMGRNQSNATSQLMATAVEFASDSTTARQTVFARREVILAAGALHTPQLLQLSGIGNASLLTLLNIPVLQDLPGVGNNLQDHCLIHLDYAYEEPDLLTPNTVFMNASFNALAQQEYLASRTGPWAGRPSTAVAFPALSHIMDQDSVSSLLQAAVQADLCLPPGYDSTLLAGFDTQRSSVLSRLPLNTTPAFENLNNNAGNLDIALMHPLSRGTVQINSSDPFAAPSIDPRWLTHPLDTATMLQAMQFNQALLNTKSLAALQPSYTAGIPFNASLPVLQSLLFSAAGTEYHYSGTAAMLPLSLGGVISPSLTVYGTANLRVVDTSVFPLIPAAHLQAVAYAVAEKAADLIRGAAPAEPGPAERVPGPAFYDWLMCALGI